jgi:hypothetical protein
MKPLVKKATPAALAVLRQATAIRPKRKKASDGLLPSAAHVKASPDSDHNTGYAVDLTHDPANGIDCADIFEKLKEDVRVDYLIFNSKIWSKARAKEGNRKYTGSNSHSKHLHISIKQGHGEDTSPWFWWMNQPKLINQVKANIAAPKFKNPYPEIDYDSRLTKLESEIKFLRTELAKSKKQ